MRPKAFRQVRLSIVVPLLDEADSLRPLHGEVVGAMEGAGIDWELVFVDDGSRDAGPRILEQLSRVDSRVRVVTLDRNYGQSAATIAGAEAAGGDWVATLDADGQNDPRDLVRMWALISDGRADGVLGVRTERRDTWVRRLASRIANGARNRLLGDTTTDVGCSTRILPRRALLDAPRFEGMHRFLPLLIRSLGYRLEEIPVGHRPRLAGRSKYRINNRLWCGLADLLMLRRLLWRSIRYSVRSPARVAEAMGAEGAGAARASVP